MRSTIALALTITISAALALATPPPRVDNVPETLKLLANDGAPGDTLGWSVGISGSFAIVGSPEDDDNGKDSGSAYLFDTTTGQRIAKLLPNDGAPGDRFGASVAISGSIAIVGAMWNGPAAGAAYLFDTTTGQQIAKLASNDLAPDDRFGISVAISGSVAVVGAIGEDDNSFNSGAAYVFDTTSGQQIAKLLANDGDVEDFFGISVGVNGTTAIVGAYWDDDSGHRSGSAYLFRTTGQQIAKLLPSDGAAWDLFGFSVGIGEDAAIVGAYSKEFGHSGAAYLFNRNTGREIAKLLPSDIADGDIFGYSVAVSGTTALVGSFGDDGPSPSWDIMTGPDENIEFGAGYLFDTTTGQQLFKLVASDPTTFKKLGFSAAISGTTAILGAFGDHDSGLFAGSAYVY